MEAHYPAVIAQRRQALGLTQDDLGYLVGVSRSQIQRYESGDSIPTLERAHQLAVALHISYELLFQDALHAARVVVQRRRDARGIA